MRFLICQKCLKGGLLCESCAKVVGEAGIKESEIKMMRKLGKVLKKYEFLKDVEIKRTVDSENMVIIVTDSDGASLLIGKDGGMAKKLAQDIGKHVRVVPYSSSTEEFIRNLFHNTHILGVNIVYSDEGKSYKIKVPRNEAASLPIEPEEFSRMTSSILNEKIELVFV